MSSNDDSKPLSHLTIGDAKRILVYGVAVVLAAWLFFWLVGHVFVALLLGVVAGVYLLPVQEWLEKRLRARTESALVTIALIIVPLVVLVGYAWYEMSGYSNLVNEKRGEIINAISASFARYFPVGREGTRVGLEATFAEAVTRSADIVQDLRKRSALLIASLVIFLFTVFYVLTQRVRLAAYIKLRVPADYLPLYEELTINVGGALRGALRAVFIDQTLKAVVIIVLNLVFGVPLAVVLGIAAFLIGFLPLFGEWAIYIPVSIYLLVFANAPISAGIYFGCGLLLTASSSLFIRPKLASAGARTFNFYWMFLALIAGVYTFGVAGVVLGPAILGFVKAVADTLLGDVKYETSLLKEEHRQQDEAAQDETAIAAAK
ncbi:MAG: AI-2E family transporter [Pyrinomonadaceae bacterium]